MKARLLKKSIAIVLAFSMLVSASACASLDNFKTTLSEGPARNKSGISGRSSVKIGVFEPLTGVDAKGAQDEIKGIELAHSIFNTVMGIPVDLVYADNQSDSVAAAIAAQELVDKDCSVVLGSYRNVLSMAAEDVFSENQLPAVGITCTNPLITSTNDYYFRVSFIDAFQGNSAAAYLTEGEGETEASILKKAGDDYASAMTELFTQHIKGDDKNGIVRNVEFPEGTTDFSSQLKRLSDAGNLFVFMPVDAKTADQIIYQADKSGYKFLWVGISSWENLVEVAKAQNPDRTNFHYLDEVRYVTEYDNTADYSSGMAQAFLSAYKREYGEENPSMATALGFDAYLLAFNAIKSAGVDASGAQLRRAMIATEDMDGATGTITISSTGDPVKEVVIEIIRQGEPAPYYVVTPVRGELE